MKKQNEEMLVRILIACLIAIGIFLLWFPGWQDRRKQAEAVHSLRNMSRYANPDNFFAKWNQPYPNGGPVEAEKEASGRFVLKMSDGRLDALDGKDLGKLGKKQAIDLISQIIWLCGSEIKYVDKISLYYEAQDGKRFVRYGVKFVPDKTFGHFWTDAQKPQLRALVEQNMVVVEDTASGWIWKTVPKE